MSVLAIDTSTAHCTVAFGERRAGVVAPTGHAEHLADLIREVVPDMTAMERIVVGVGPGPYTGLRVGVVTAATMSLALGIPAAGVCSLDGLGRRLGDGVVVTDVVRSDSAECALNQATAGAMPVPGFGASDCKHGCGSHLKYLGW